MGLHRAGHRPARPAPHATVLSERDAPHTSHWGAYTAEVADGRLVRVHPHAGDPAPSALLGNIVEGNRRARVERPVVRRGWLEDGPGPDRRRGADEWVPCSWEEVTDRLAAELRRVIDDHGNQAIYAGSYGWGSAGRFHHAQSQLRRFCNLIGGATRSVGTYSNAAAEVTLRRVVGSAEGVWRGATTWPVIARETDLMVCFGGLPAKNVSVAPGGVGPHTIPGDLAGAVARGMDIALVSPIADDVAPELGAEWLPLRPATDTAVMLALAQVLVAEGLHDAAFLDRWCVGADRFLAYLDGSADGVAKTPEWAQAISGLDAGRIRSLARRMAAGRTMVTASWSLQRGEHGEQPVWASVALAAVLGQIGLPGGGFGSGYGSMADVGTGASDVRVPSFPSGPTTVPALIPVARVSDMLLGAGTPYEHDGRSGTYPDIRLVYWTGGNPFHHHQDLGRFRAALRRTDTVVVHEPFWTPTARHADVVLPVTTTLERDDIAAGRGAWLQAMHQAVAPYGEARSDHAIFAGLAERMGVGEAFTEGRSERAWLAWMYDELRDRLATVGVDAPSFEDFWDAGELELPGADRDLVLFDAFRADPEGAPLRTPSGRIELFSETVAGFGYDDCPGHPVWLEPDEWLGGVRAATFPLHLIANNPARRLHSQLDAGGHSQAGKVHGREPIRLHPEDAAARGIAEGDVVRVFNDRGACLAGAVLSAALRPGVAQLSTGAWYDPDDPSALRPLCVHGNPNVLTRDRGTSQLAQGCTGQHVLVDVARYEGEPPPIRAYDVPSTA